MPAPEKAFSALSNILAAITNQVKTLPKVISLAGPTAAGKTDLAIQLARNLNAEIISCDSRAIYKNLKYLTAVPPGKWKNKTYITREGVPYHLVDFLSPAKRLNASTYAKHARALIGQILARKPFVIVAGGTGLYHRALFEGLSPLPQAKPALRRKLEKKLKRYGIKHLLAELKQRDLETYLKIDRKNPRRVVRALELIKTLKEPLGRHLTGGKKLNYPYKGFYLSWPRPKLKERIKNRAKNHFKTMCKEVAALKRSYGINTPAWESLLAEPVDSYLKGEISRQASIDECAKRDAAYAKKQMTWFKKNKELITIDMAHKNPYKQILNGALNGHAR